MPPAELRYLQHFQLLSAIPRAIEYGLAALEKHEVELRKNAKDGSEIADALAQIRDGIMGFGHTLRPKVKPSRIGFEEVEETLQQFAESLAAAKPSGEQLLNLGLVMLCTQLELFISHLIDVVLATEPRRLLRALPDMEIKIKEALELDEGEDVMEPFRDMVAEEIGRAGTKEKFVTHLGERLGLIDPSEIKVAPLVESAGAGAFQECNLDMVIRLFDERRRVVHRGVLPVRDIPCLKKAQLIFQSIVTVLTINAVRKYNIRLDSPASAGLACALGKSVFGVPRSHLEEFVQKTHESTRELQ